MGTIGLIVSEMRKESTDDHPMQHRGITTVHSDIRRWADTLENTDREYSLVAKDIHPLDQPHDCSEVVRLLAKPPSAKEFSDELEYYNHWWGLLIAAAAPRNA